MLPMCTSTWVSCPWHPSTVYFLFSWQHWLKAGGNFHASARELYCLELCSAIHMTEALPFKASSKRLRQNTAVVSATCFFFFNLKSCKLILAPDSTFLPAPLCFKEHHGRTTGNNVGRRAVGCCALDIAWT